MGVREQVRSRFRVVREMGDEMLVPCPLPEHEDRNPSASINVRKSLWVCYSCGRGGKLETLLGERIADPNIDELLTDIATSLAGFDSVDHGYPESWLDQFDAAGVHNYWRSRKLSDRVCRLFRLGYDPSTGAATYPLRGPSGVVLGVVRRATDPQKVPKYRYPDHAPVSKTLYGYHLIREGVRDVVVTEGALDAMAMWDVDVPAVSQLGARLSNDQVDLLKRLGTTTLTFAYDQDEAGEKALQRALSNPRLDFCPLRVMRWDPILGKDPMDLEPDERLAAYHDAKPVWSSS